MLFAKDYFITMGNRFAGLIREMSNNDIPTVVTIENMVQHFPWSEQTLSDCLRVGYHGYIIEVQQAIAGFAYISIAAQECHILNLAIHPDYQSKGLGRQLMLFLLDKARTYQANMVFLEVRISNDKAIKLYRSLDFNEIGIRRGYYQAVNGREDGVMLGLEVQTAQF